MQEKMRPCTKNQITKTPRKSGKMQDQHGTETRGAQGRGTASEALCRNGHARHRIEHVNMMCKGEDAVTWVVTKVIVTPVLNVKSRAQAIT